MPRDPFHTLRHLGGRTPRKSHQQDTTRVGAIDQKVGDAMRQRVGLARSGAGDDEQRAADRARRDAVFGGVTLLGVEAAQMIEVGWHGRIIGKWQLGQDSLFSFCSQSSNRSAATGGSASLRRANASGPLTRSGEPVAKLGEVPSRRSPRGACAPKYLI